MQRDERESERLRGMRWSQGRKGKRTETDVKRRKWSKKRESRKGCRN